MNVLIYTHHYPAPDRYHLEKDTHVVRYFAEKLREKGHNVRVVRLHYTPLKACSFASALRVIPEYSDYEYNEIPVHLIRYQMLTPHRFYPEGFQAGLINRHLRRWKKSTGFRPDKVFVHFPTVFTGIHEIFADTPAVLGDCHNLDAMLLDNGKFGPAAREFLGRFSVLGYRNKRVQGCLSSKFSMPLNQVYTGIDNSLLADAGFIERKKNNNSSVLKLIYVGQLIKLKNVDILIEAFNRLSFPAELTIVGDGDQREKLTGLAAGNPAIHFTGWLDRNIAVEKMKEADALVMVSSPETYGMVYLEAMAVGSIAVAAAGEGFDGIILDGRNGYLVPPRDVDALVRRLEALNGLTAAEKARIVDESYKTAMALTEDKTTELFLELNTAQNSQNQISNEV